MEKHNNQQSGQVRIAGKPSILRKAVLISIFSIAFVILLFAAAIAYNNIDPWSDKVFALRLDSAIKNGENWIRQNRQEILKVRNAPLIAMLRDCNEIHNNQVFSDIATSFLNKPIWHPSRCLNRIVDPNFPVSESDFNLTFSKENLDNKWFLTVTSPDKAKVKSEELGLFDPDRWHRRQLTHQIFALKMLRDRQGANEKINKLLNNLCNRTKTDMTFCIPVVDIYIQRATFVLHAGNPQKVRRRWIERIISEQQSDGGWNDRWLCFTTTRSHFIFDFDETPSDQHATIQAVLALYLVKYSYPEQFGLK